MSEGCVCAESIGVDDLFTAGTNLYTQKRVGTNVVWALCTFVVRPRVRVGIEKNNNRFVRTINTFI